MLKANNINTGPGFKTGCSTKIDDDDFDLWGPFFPSIYFMKYILGQKGFDRFLEFAGVNPEHPVIRAKT